MSENTITFRKQAKVANTIVKHGSHDYTFLCPNCGCDYTHHYEVEIFWKNAERSDTGRRVTVRSGKVMKENNAKGIRRSSQGYDVLIHFYCEYCDAISTLAIIQNHGITNLETTFCLTKQEREVASSTELCNK